MSKIKELYELVSDRTDHNCETCFCIGPQNEEKYCPCKLRDPKYRYEELFEDMTKEEQNYFLYGKWEVDKDACLWDGFSEEAKMEPMWLSCPCPKCTPRC